MAERAPAPTQPTPQPTQAPQPAAEGRKYELSRPVRKGFRSIFKGLAVLFGGPLAIAGVIGYNVARGAYNLYKRRVSSGLSYMIGGALAWLAPVPYGIGLEATGAYRIATNKDLPQDRDWVRELYSRRQS